VPARSSVTQSRDISPLRKLITHTALCASLPTAETPYCYLGAAMALGHHAGAANPTRIGLST